MEQTIRYVRGGEERKQRSILPHRFKKVVMIILLSIVLFGIFIISNDCSLVSAQAGRNMDVEVHIKELFVTGGDEPHPDPFVTIDVRGGETRTAVSPVSPDIPLTDPPQHTLESFRAYFKDVPSDGAGGYRIDFWVEDDDLFWDPDMATGEFYIQRADESGSRREEGPWATVTIEVTLYLACTGQDTGGAFIYVDRSSPPKVDLYQDFNVTLFINDTEAHPPEHVIVTEQIPGDFAYVGASLPPVISYINVDGYNYTILKWAFDGADVQDTYITYTLKANTKGVYLLAGTLETENMTLVTTGGTDVLASGPLDTDVNHDGTVNILDISAAGKAFGTKPGDLKWNKEVDVNFDGQINILDLAKIAKDFGKSVTLPLP